MAQATNKRLQKKRRGILVGASAIVRAALSANTHHSVALAFHARQSATIRSRHRQRNGTFSLVPTSDSRIPHDAIKTILLAGNKENKEATATNTMDFENMDLLYDLVVASSLSYLSSELLIDNEDGSTRSNTKMETSPYFSKSLTPLVQVVDPKTESGATIFGYNNDSILVVACRGSATPINFSTNIRFRLLPLDGSNEEFLVHEGFQDATNGLWKLLAEKLDKLTDNYSSILFTGHSLGAANALLCATKYQSQSNASKRLPLGGVITFGGPRLVNTRLAEEWNSKLLGPPIVVRNYVHDKDPILRQNGPLWDSLGFGIVGREIPCEPFEPKAYHSEEEQASKDLPLAWNILDHCNYLGVFVGPRLI